MSDRPYCTCEVPKPWMNAKGKSTNICEACNGQIPLEQEPSHLSRLLINTEGAVNAIDLYDSEEERERFVRHLADTVTERTRQQFLSWRGGRSERKPATIKG